MTDQNQHGSGAGPPDAVGAEERLRLLTEAVRDYGIFLTGPTGQITWWGEGIARLTGYTAGEVISRDFAMLFTESDRAAGLPERELRTAAESGHAADENWSVRKDGSLFWAAGTSTALRDDAGGLRGFAKVVRDLTERREAQEALRESELRLRAALSAARMGTWLWQVQTDKYTLDESLHRLLGVPEGRSVRTLDDFLSFIHPDDRAATAGALRRSAEEGVPLAVEFRVPTAGGVIWLRDQGEAVKDEQGRLAYVTGACVDVTEARRSRDELERLVERRTADLLQAERLAAVGRTVAALSHEGRNSIQRTTGLLARLRMRLEGQAEALELVDRADAAQRDLARLFDDLRGFAGPVLLERRGCDLAEVWREAWAEATAAHPGREARLEADAAGVALEVNADPFRLRQVFRILFDNAVEACPGAVAVRLGCSNADVGGRPAVRVTVRDSGPGIPVEQRARLFEPFATTKARGSGLGLPIARRIVEAHGGTIEAGEGGPGAELIVTLPRGRE